MGTDPATDGALFHTDTGTALTGLMVDGHRETWPMRALLHPDTWGSGGCGSCRRR
jgi:hypothetical protein